MKDSGNNKWELIEGDKVKVIGNTCNHRTNIGDIVTIKKKWREGVWEIKESVYVLTDKDIVPYYSLKDYVIQAELL